MIVPFIFELLSLETSLSDSVLVLSDIKICLTFSLLGQGLFMRKPGTLMLRLSRKL